MIKDMLINDILIKHTKGRINNLIREKTKSSQENYIKTRINILESYMKDAHNMIRSSKRREAALDEYNREIKQLTYQLKQLSIQS